VFNKTGIIKHVIKPKMQRLMNMWTKPAA